jgi:HAMP domain-containing protein
MRAAARVIASLEGGLRRLRRALHRRPARSGPSWRGLMATLPPTAALPSTTALPGMRALPADGIVPHDALLEGAVPNGLSRLLRAPGARVPLALVRAPRAVRPPGSSHWAVGPTPAGVRGRLWWLSDRWRRSLQLRVITATLVLSAIVVSVLGYVLMQHLVTELYSDKVQSSANIADPGLAIASGVAAFNEPRNSQTRQAMYNLAQQLASTGGTPYALEVTLPTADQGPPVYSGGAAVGFFRSLPLLPQPLVKKVLTQNSAHHAPQQYWTSMAVVATGSTPVPGLLIGSSFGYDYRYQLYYFFPLAAEQHSIASMQRTLLLVGIAVVFLLVAIAWLVTRWVVIPVRLAAAGARRLAAGALNERMEVRGNDELAALATSFNEMAASLQEKLAELQDLSQVQRQFPADHHQDCLGRAVRREGWAGPSRRPGG